jgi:uncharacterized protein (TIGR00730 family)
MAEIRKVCVYCGSGPGSDPDFGLAARKFGKILAESGVGLVYGGGSIGLMGEIANAVLDNGGHVTGIIPDFLANREHRMHRGEIIRTRNMHERKQLMFEHADGFVALPGGVGTLEEVVEQMTWVQLGHHKKPVLLANIKGFWEPLRALLAHMEELNFIRPGLLVDDLMADRIEDMLPMLRAAAAKIPEPQQELASEVAGRM